MELGVIRKEYTMFFIVVNFGTGSKVLKEAKNIGVSGGTIFLGKGAAKNHLLELLGLDEIKKEIILMVSEINLEDQIHEKLTEKFHLNKPNHGIAFSLPVKKVLGARRCSTCSSEIKTGGKDQMGYEVVFIIVDRGFAEEVVDAAVSAGAEGGTIINARGSGVHENSMFFSMAIEPEKEIVMILIEKEKADFVIESISKTIHIDEPGKGIMISMDVSKTSGLFRSSV